VTAFACKLLSEQQGFGSQKASVCEPFPEQRVQNEAEVRGSTPVPANEWGKNTAAAAALIKFALYWASLIFLRAMQLEVELLSVRSWYSLLTALCLFSRVTPGIIEVLSCCRSLKGLIES